MPPFPAARKNDLTVHFPVKIATGSPDTTIGGQPAARLNDLATPCPLPPCKPPLGKIVTSSRTVFINKLGAARVTDLVLDGAKGMPPGPPGCSHPPAKGYEARKGDHHEELMAVEHEASDWDEVDEYQREKYDGARERAASPVGVARGGKTKITKMTKQGGGSPHGGEVAAPPKKSAAKKASSMPSSAAGANGGGGMAPKIEPEKARGAQPHKLDLAFPIDISFGKAKGSAGMGAGPNLIALGCFTVIVG